MYVLVSHQYLGSSVDVDLFHEWYSAHTIVRDWISRSVHSVSVPTPLGTSHHLITRTRHHLLNRTLPNRCLPSLLFPIRNLPNQFSTVPILFLTILLQIQHDLERIPKTSPNLELNHGYQRIYLNNLNLNLEPRHQQQLDDPNSQ
jgi:hypothetical protein